MQDRRHEYKQRSSTMTQEQRRLALLQKQKERRAQQLSRWRGEVSSETDGATSDEASRAGAMDTGTVDGSAAGGAACEARAYAGRLMRGELMDAIPSDLSDFVAVPCPPGRQVLVVAGAGRTVGYTRTGYQCLACPSELPGGGARGKRTPHEHTVLDCILDESSKTLYAVDIITWNGYPTDSKCVALAQKMRLTTHTHTHTQSLVYISFCRFLPSYSLHQIFVFFFLLFSIICVFLRPLSLFLSHHFRY